MFLLIVLLFVAMPVVRRATWHGDAEFHTVLESLQRSSRSSPAPWPWCAYYAKRSSTFLLIGSGFLGASLLDGFHALITSSFLAGRTPTSLPALTHWSGAVSHVFLSLLLLASLVAWKRRPTPWPIRGASCLYIVVGSWTLASFLFFLWVPLKPAYYPQLHCASPDRVGASLLFHSGGHWIFPEWLLEVRPF